MTTHPFIPLYIDDFEAATAHLSPEEDGIYNRLLRLCWRTPGCSLPDDAAWIARKIRVSAEDFERVARGILGEFFTFQRGRWIQGRLKREYDAISRKKNARKLAGKKGGEAKARNEQEKSASNTTVLPPHTRAFPEPEPESEPYKKERTDANASVGATRPPSQKSAGRGTRLDPGWLPSETDIAHALAEGLTREEIDRAAEEFRNYWLSLAGAKATKLDWTRTWRNRVMEHADRKRIRSSRLAPRAADAGGGGRGASSFADIFVRRHGSPGDGF